MAVSSPGRVDLSCKGFIPRFIDLILDLSVSVFFTMEEGRVEGYGCKKAIQRLALLRTSKFSLALDSLFLWVNFRNTVNESDTISPYSFKLTFINFTCYPV